MSSIRSGELASSACSEASTAAASNAFSPLATGALASVTVRFVVTDTDQRIPVEYRGILPDLFREGKGVVAQGKLGEDNHFTATEVLAKHDENYMPKEVYDSLKKAAGEKGVKEYEKDNATSATDRQGSGG